MEIPDGDVETYTTEEELASAIVEQWMNSDGQRENILQNYWQSEGIGVYITDDGEIFATQNFCEFVQGVTACRGEGLFSELTRGRGR